MRIALVAASLVLVAGGAVGCGGGGDKGDSAPTNASKSDFCSSIATFFKDEAAVDTSTDTKTQIKKAKDEIEKLSKVGTPSGMPSDARKGYETFINAIEKVDDNASKSDLENFDKKLSATDQKNLTAFITYVGTECPEALGGAS